MSVKKKTKDCYRKFQKKLWNKHIISNGNYYFLYIYNGLKNAKTHKQKTFK